MAKVKVLIKGYAKKLKKGWSASSTTCLITTEDKKIITDPGCNRKKLLEALDKEGLTTGDIDIVFLTHHHPDHAFLAAIFENAVTVDGDTIYEDDKETEFEGKIPGTNLTPIPTPGHADEHHALLVSTDEGKVVVAGDVFWWMDEERQRVDIKKQDPFAKDGKALIESRKKLLQLADWLIPGHGKMFKNPKKEN